MTTGKSLLQERNDFKICDHEECLSVLETAKNRLVLGQVSTEREEELQNCCRKTGEHEPPIEEERCRDERAQLQPFWAVFHAMLEETSLVTHLHKSHAFAVPKHGYHHFLSTGGNPKFLRWR